MSIIAPGKCGACAPNQPGGFPYCAPNDDFGFAPVCGTDGKTYRNKGAAWAAGTAIAVGGPCDKTCGEAVSVSGHDMPCPIGSVFVTSKHDANQQNS